MDAFIEIIEKLVECVPAQNWLEQNQFPFKNLIHPRAHVHDICLFETNAQGAYGFLWIQFETIDDLLIFPFHLARYKEDGDLIALSPWSLKNASYDNNFYNAWRIAQKQKNPLITSKKAYFLHKKQVGEASFIAMNIWSDLRTTCVRLDFQITYKIFRVLEKNHPQSIEADMLSYLGNQNIFTQFAKMISIFEYNSKEFSKAPIAISMRYIQNNGPLFTQFVSLFQKARFSQKHKSHQAHQAWQELLNYTQSLARLLGNFHKAMALAPKQSNLAAEHCTKVSKDKWFSIMSKKLDERLNSVLLIQKYHNNFSGIFYLLPNYVEKIKQKISEIDEIGMRIQNHGRIHLGQILLGLDQLILLDYDSNNYEDPHFRRLKQPCLYDTASLIISLRFSWYFTERKYYNLFSNNEYQSIQNSQLNSNAQEIQNKNLNIAPSLKELEQLFSKFYKNCLDEHMISEDLTPNKPNSEKIIFDFCFIIQILNEICAENPEGNPRTRLWLYILQDFMMQEK